MLTRDKGRPNPSPPGKKQTSREPMNSKLASDTAMVIRALGECVPSKPILESEESSLATALGIPRNVQVIQGVEGVAFCSKGLNVPDMDEETDPFLSVKTPSWVSSPDAWYLAVRPEGIAISLLLIDNSRKLNVRVEISSEREDDGLERSWQEVMRVVGSRLH